MNTLPNCPKCNSEYVYEDGLLLVCPECAYEWDPNAEVEEGLVALDANGVKLADGDTVTLIKDLKVKGAPKDLMHGPQLCRHVWTSIHLWQSPFGAICG